MVSTAAFHARVRGSVPGLGGLKETRMFLPHPLVKLSFVGSLRDREVACSASDRQGPNFESCVSRTVSSHSSHHPQEVLLAQFSLYVHKGGLKPYSFHFILPNEISFYIINAEIHNVPCGRTVEYNKLNFVRIRRALETQVRHIMSNTILLVVSRLPRPTSVSALLTAPALIWELH